VAGLLKKNGNKVKIVDLNAEARPVVELEFSGCECVISSAMISNIEQDMKVLKEAKKRGKITIVIVHDPYFPEEIMGRYPFVDYFVREERELATLNLIKTLKARADVSKVKGVVWRKGGKVTSNTKQEPVDLSFLGVSSYEGLSLEDYDEAVVIAGKGCNYNCGFCYWAQSKHRYRALKDVIKEIRFLKKYQFDHYYIYDLNFTTSRGYVTSFCRALIRENARIDWICDGRVNEVDKQLLLLMEKAGCKRIIYGIESGSDFSLGKMRKGFTSEEAYNKIRLTREIGITPYPCFILGYPWEDKTNIALTENFIKRIVPKYTTIFGLNFVNPVPSSRLYQEMLEDRITKGVSLGKMTKLGTSIADWENRPFAGTRHLSKEQLVAVRKRILRRAFYMKFFELSNYRIFFQYPFKKKLCVIKEILNI
jgi:radical SAM superfamily enzyme YgiQ (UPF0313 family)